MRKRGKMTAAAAPCAPTGRLTFAQYLAIEKAMRDGENAYFRRRVKKYRAQGRSYLSARPRRAWMSTEETL